MTNLDQCWHTVHNGTGEWTVHLRETPGDESMTITGHVTAGDPGIIPVLQVFGLIEQLPPHEELILNVMHLSSPFPTPAVVRTRKVSLTLHGVFSFTKISVLTNSLTITKDADCPTVQNPAN